jgi:hypothetical protein
MRLRLDDRSDILLLPKLLEGWEESQEHGTVLFIPSANYCSFIAGTGSMVGYSRFGIAECESYVY